MKKKKKERKKEKISLLKYPLARKISDNNKDSLTQSTH